MTIIECDRCHLSSKDDIEIYQIAATASKQDDTWDLCAHCYTEFTHRFLTMNSTKEMLPHE